MMCLYTRIYYICGHTSLIRELDATCTVRDERGNIVGCSLNASMQSASHYNPQACHEDLPCSAKECRVSWTSRRAAGYHMQGVQLNVAVNIDDFTQAFFEYHRWRQTNPAAPAYPSLSEATQ